MRFVEILIPLILCLAAILVLRVWSSTGQHMLHGFSYSPVLLFSVLNSIIIAILVLSQRPSSQEVEGRRPPQSPMYEGEEGTQDNTKGYIEDEEDEEDEEDDEDGDESDDDDDQYHGSDGYDEDCDDDSSEEDIFWQDEDDKDNNLEMRIESFIAKVNEEWRKERLGDFHGHKALKPTS